jgi:ferric-dicitrate binding protein FerR (iron transport regulator)
MTQRPDLEQRIVTHLNAREAEEKEEQIIEAGRILSEIETVDTISAFKKVQGQISKGNKKIRLITILTRVAAILFIPLLIASLLLLYNKEQNQDHSTTFVTQEITCPPGMRSQVILPDGSKVWLNSESTIKFRIPFSEDIRKVDLIGEAFFDVTKNPKQPFIVKSANVGVKVYGTRFNYKAYQEDKNIEVILEEGSVGLTVRDEGMHNKTRLTPGDHAVIAKESNAVNIKNEKIDKYIAWHTGKLVFENTPMSEVALMLERWYGIEVIVQNPEIMDYSFTTTFDNESLFEVIELLEISSPIRIKYIPATIGKENNPQTKSKVLINKK